MKLKLFFLALLAQLCLTTASAYDAKINGIYYTLSKTEAIVTYGDDKYTGDIVIPQSVIYNDVTYSVTSIGRSAFSNCSGLTSISIPESVTSIDYGAFFYCSGLTSITIPESVTSIGDWAFEGCSGLTSIIIPKNVTFIGRYVFSACSSLASIQVESGNTVYDSRDHCNAIIVTATNTLKQGCMNTVIPNSVVIIGAAFRGCTGLTSITIPNSVTDIQAEAAFEGCSGLKSIKIGSGLKNLGKGTFDYGCSAISSIQVASDNPYFDSRNDCNAIISTESNTLRLGCMNTVIPNSVTSIGRSAFSNCSGLTSITIPESVTSIGVWAFNGCSGLTSITIPESVTSIGDDAFCGCSGLKDVYCLAEEIPTTTNESPFSTTIANPFPGVLSTATLHVPASVIEDYKTTEPWSGFNNIVALEEATDKIVTLSAAGYATFYDGQASFILPKGLSACVVTAANDHQLTYQTIAEGSKSGIIPKGIAVVLKSDKRQAGTFTLTRTTEEKRYEGSNMLRGRDVSTTTYADGDSYFYKLAYGPTGTAQAKTFGWYWGATDGGAFTIDGHKAWLAIPKSAAVKALFYDLEGEATAIADLNTERENEQNAVFYDLQGRRVVKPQRRGVYIRNGQKVFIR